VRQNLGDVADLHLRQARKGCTGMVDARDVAARELMAISRTARTGAAATRVLTSTGQVLVWGATFRGRLPIRGSLPMTISLHRLDITSMRSNSFAAAAAIGTLLVAGCGTASRQAFLSAATTPVPTAAGTGPAAGTSGDLPVRHLSSSRLRLSPTAK
jgi:hypothetical protein